MKSVDLWMFGNSDHAGNKLHADFVMDSFFYLNNVFIN